MSYRHLSITENKRYRQCSVGDLLTTGWQVEQYG